MNQKTLGWVGISFMAMLLVVSPLAAQPLVIQHHFTNNPDGANPQMLSLSSNLFFGATFGGGSGYGGSLFKFELNGTGYTNFFNFNSAVDGSSPNNLLVVGNLLYGTAQIGSSNGYGAIFSVNTEGGNFTPLRTFGLTPDGQYPRGGLVLADATLYGTTSSGGTNGQGCIFKLATNGANFTILRSFTNSPDGAGPRATLLADNATLYGTSYAGGTYGNGGIFKLNTNGSGYSLIYSFSNYPDGQFPEASLILYSNQLYGTTSSGGSSNYGTVFVINTNGTGYNLLHSFSGPTLTLTNSDGSTPNSALAASNGFLFGNATGGGANNKGTLFVMRTDGSGFTLLRNFNGATDGANPRSTMTLVSNVLWGTSYTGGSLNVGTVFSLSLNPLFTGQPQNLTVTNGNPASFVAVATNAGLALNYQWYFNTNTLLAGQTNTTLMLASAATNNAGNYTVTASNLFGVATSSPAGLTVLVFTPPTITAAPQTLNATNGNPANFSVTASGVGMLNYQWYFNTNTALLGETATNLIIASAAAENAGTYTVVISNYVGAVTSAPALLTVSFNTSPSILTEPQDLNVVYSNIANFSVTAVGQSPLTYQWYSNAVPMQVFGPVKRLSGQTNATLALTVTMTNVSYYSVIISNSLGKATSSAAMLTVIAVPVITTNPEPVMATSGDPVSFTVDVLGASPLRYQWYFNTNTVLTNQLGNLLAGRTNSTLAFATASNGLIGRYSVIVTNSFGRDTSSPALLSIVGGTPPSITLQPLNRTITNGNSVTFLAAATGTNPLSYQWLFNTNQFIGGATNTTLTFSNANVSGTYALRVTNTFGAVTSTPALLTVIGKPLLLASTFNPVNGSYAFSYANLAGSTNRLWASTNLATTNFWKAIATNIMATNALWLFTDMNTAATNAVRFYRFSTP